MVNFDTTTRDEHEQQDDDLYQDDFEKGVLSEQRG